MVCQGGIHHLANALERLLKKQGFRFINIDVTSIDTYFNQVIGVRLDNGTHSS